MYIWKIYKWENEETFENLSDYLVMPVFYEDRLNEELDTASVTLDCVPITVNDGVAFPPKTKFRLICTYFNEEKNIEESENYDMVVDHDDVEYYEGEPNICCHRISLIEASVIAQGMHVDNIALTYELRDVTLNYATSTNISTPVTVNYKNIGEQKNNTAPNIPKNDYEFWGQKEIDLVNKTPKKYFEYNNYFTYEWDLKPEELKDSDGSWIEDLPYMRQKIEEESVKIKVPRLYCYTRTTEIIKLFELPIKVTIVKRKYFNIEDKVGEIIGEPIEYICGPDQYQSIKDDPYSMYRIVNNDKAGITAIAGGWWPGKGDPTLSLSVPIFEVNALYKGTTIYTTEENPLYELNKTSTVGSSTEKRISIIELTLPKLGDDEYKGGAHVIYEIKATPYLEVDENSHFGLIVRKRFFVKAWPDGTGTSASVQVFHDALSYEKVEDAFIETKFIKGDLTLTWESKDYIKRPPKKYNAYDLLKKAFLTVDTRILNTNANIDDIEYPITVGDEEKRRLEQTEIYEMTFENKNLWEILLTVGNYVHAIPYLEFSKNGNFILKFRDLGTYEITSDGNDGRILITKYGNRVLSDFYSSMDSYVANLFSPENNIEEIIVPKTSESTYLISNDTAQLHTTFPILELISLKVSDGNNEWKDITESIFEKSVYSILSNENPSLIYPAKGNSLYYEHNTNIIDNLNYVAPVESTGDFKTALKYIYERYVDSSKAWSLNYNELRFKVEYKTSDDARITAFRPDLYKYLKHSVLDCYPHNEQYYGQQEKIADSERFSRKLYGELIRRGNMIYERQEYVTNSKLLKKGGQLVLLNNNGVREPYYVAVCENENYHDSIFQKVTYSKDFNQLSQIVTVPSEPRFYEVATKNIIRRDVRFNDFFKLSTSCPSTVHPPKFLKGVSNVTTWVDTLINLLFELQYHNLPNYVYMRYTCDTIRAKERGDAESSMFPSSQYTIIAHSDGYYFPNPTASQDHADCIVPIQRYPMQNSIVFEWDMVDNFSAGSFIDTNIKGTNTNENAYYGQAEARYVDLYGRADFCRFGLFRKDNWDIDTARLLPITEYSDKSNDDLVNISCFAGELKKYIALDKDNREALSFNYQITLLHDDEFVLFSNLFGEKKGSLSVYLFSREILKSEQYIGDAPLVYGLNIDYKLKAYENYIVINFDNINNSDLSEVKCIALVDENGNDIYYARNVGKIENKNKLDTWYIYPIYND